MTGCNRPSALKCGDFQLAFGTGGLRGLLGDGPDKMNLDTVSKATRGVAKWAGIGNSIVIAYDTRNMSREFAGRTAEVLAANGVRAYLFPRPVPTPALSFAVRHLSAGGGICITASHNPAEYNGYKVYGRGGGQITLDDAAVITEYIRDEGGAKTAAASVGTVPEQVMEAYIGAVEALRMGGTPCGNLRIAYTPLNGAGRECVCEILRRLGAETVLVAEQAGPDGNFPTCPKPNPEEKSALELGIKLCLDQNCDLLLATDPDCDRVGVAVNHHGAVRRLTGNEIGVLLLDYIIRERKENGTLPQHPVAVKTIVTTPMAAAVCDGYGIELRDVLTGFKYIGEQINLLERDGEAERFIFGFEESCGYLSGTHARDKDGVNAALLIAELASECKRRGQTLVDAIERLYERYGRWTTRLNSYGVSAEAVGRLRTNPPKKLLGQQVLGVTDYLRGVNGLPSADVLQYTLSGGTVVIRPSGTEPKVKIYTTLKGDVDETVQTDAGFSGLFMGRDEA